PGGAAGVGALRAQEGLVHGGGVGPAGPVPGGAGRDAVPGRGGGHAPAFAGQATEGPGGAQSPPGGLARELRGGRAGDLGDAPQAGGAHCERGVPGGPVLPAERGEADDSVAGGAARGHTAAGEPFPGAAGGALSAGAPGVLAGGDATAGVGAVAGEREAAPERDRAGGGA